LITNIQYGLKLKSKKAPTNVEAYVFCRT